MLLLNNSGLSGEKSLVGLWRVNVLNNSRVVNLNLQDSRRNAANDRICAMVGKRGPQLGKDAFGKEDRVTSFGFELWNSDRRLF